MSDNIINWKTFSLFTYKIQSIIGMKIVEETKCTGSFVKMIALQATNQLHACICNLHLEGVDTLPCSHGA